MNSTIYLSGRVAANQSKKHVAHLLRESWRRKQFDGFMKSARRDARALQGLVYSEARIKALRNSVLTSHSLAVLTGASVSPACFDVQTNSSVSAHTCPWCASQQVVADLQHVTWDCPQARAKSGLVPGDAWDAAQKRLGWPTRLRGRETRDQEILQWLAMVRRSVLDDRNNPHAAPGVGGGGAPVRSPRRQAAAPRRPPGGGSP